MVDIYADKIELEEDEGYFRVIIQHGTHRLHSEKMNISTATETMLKFLGLKNE